MARMLLMEEGRRPEGELPVRPFCFFIPASREETGVTNVQTGCTWMADVGLELNQLGFLSTDALGHKSAYRFVRIT